MKERFASIDVNKTKKAIEKGKSPEEALNVRNEIKIITADEITFNLWSEVISSFSQGDLVEDPETMRLFRERAGWNPEKEGVVNRELFKYLGNMTTGDHRRLAEHILNRPDDKRKWDYPKVLMKKSNAVVESCYSYKDWIERRKRKALVRRELNNIQPGLNFFRADGELILDRWKKFKRDYHVTSATMNVLTEAPGKEFFSKGKQTSAKNKKADEISPYAKAVLRLFLKKKKAFVKPVGKAFMRMYDSAQNVIGHWAEGRWESCRDDLALGIIDFRRVPNFTCAAEYSASKPYFQSFMNLLSNQSAPGLTDPPAWLWICGDTVAETQIRAFAQDHMDDNYLIRVSYYQPSQNERLEDRPSSNQLAKARVPLVFLLKKGSKFEQKCIPSEFHPPVSVFYEKPGKYNELEYRMSASELRMEFYLKVMQLFGNAGDTILSVFGGGKIVCSGMVSLAPTELKLLLYFSYAVLDFVIFLCIFGKVFCNVLPGFVFLC